LTSSSSITMQTPPTTPEDEQILDQWWQRNFVYNNWYANQNHHERIPLIANCLTTLCLAPWTNGYDSPSPFSSSSTLAPSFLTPNALSCCYPPRRSILVCMLLSHCSLVILYLISPQKLHSHLYFMHSSIIIISFLSQ
jgi:hypothetical protein